VVVVVAAQLLVMLVMVDLAVVAVTEQLLVQHLNLDSLIPVQVLTQDLQENQLPAVTELVAVGPAK
jgi:hypothetical protein